METSTGAQRNGGLAVKFVPNEEEIDNCLVAVVKGLFHCGLATCGS